MCDYKTGHDIGRDSDNISLRVGCIVSDSVVLEFVDGDGVFQDEHTEVLETSVIIDAVRRCIFRQ